MVVRLAARASALRGLREAFGRAPNRLKMPVVEIADLGAVVEQHAVPLPVESVREQHLPLGLIAGWWGAKAFMERKAGRDKEDQ